MDLGIVTPEMSRYGGSQIYLLECLKRWQHKVDITLYTCSVNRALFEEFGIERKVKISILPSLSSQGGRNGDGLLEESLILPHIWEQKLLRHDLYFLYLFPTQMIRRHPSVWFAAEPLRMLYDLRHTSYSPNGEVEVHFYPKLNYDVIDASRLDVLLQLIEKIDSSPVCDRLVTNSRATGRYLENVYNRKPDLVVYPGINPPMRVTPVTGSKRAISVGKLWKQKRVDLIIRAFSLIPEGELVIVGDGPERPFLKQLSRDLGLTRRVRFTGEVSKQRLEKLLSESAFCVYTPVREPFGMVPLEAAAAGRAVVGTIGGGYSEILDESSARLVPPSAEKIAEAMQTLFDNPALVRSMGESARKAVASYTWERTADSLLRCFYETVEHTSPKRGQIRRKPQLGAYYYPWYRAGQKLRHWNENTEFTTVTDFPLGGPYSSDRASVIRRHLRMAVNAGLDFFVVNWQVTFQGVNPTEVKATKKLFRIAEDERFPIRFSILLSVDAEDPGVVRDALETVREELIPSRVYHTWGKKPLVWYYLNGPFMGYFFSEHKELLRLNRGLHPIAAGALAYNKCLPRLLKEFFSGWCLYSPLEVGAPKIRETIWEKSYRDFHEDGGNIQVFTLCPGYDDSRLDSYERINNKYRVVPRRGGRTYEEMQEAVCRLRPLPDLAVITSFNEFHENTHIEPSQRFGDTYLQFTKVFSDRLKNMQ